METSRGISKATTGPELPSASAVTTAKPSEEDDMGFGRGMLLWLLGIPLPIIILLALFWR